MASKSLAKKLSKKFNWTQKQANEALEGFKYQPSILESKQLERFLNICIDCNSPEERYEKATLCFLPQLSKKDLLETICGLLYIDSGFIALATFNTRDYIETNGEFIREKYLFLPDEAVDDPRPRYLEENEFYETSLLLPFNYDVSHIRSRYIKADQDIKFYTSPEEMTYSFIDLFFKTTHIRDTKSLINLYYEIYRRVGLKILNVRHFRMLVNELNDLASSNQFFDDWNDFIGNIFTTNNFTKIQHNERRYWLYYLGVQYLKEKGLTAKRSFNILSEITKEGSSTIHRTYYRMKEKAENNNLSAEEILRKFLLNHEYMDLIDKINSQSKA